MLEKTRDFSAVRLQRLLWPFSASAWLEGLAPRPPAPENMPPPRTAPSTASVRAPKYSYSYIFFQYVTVTCQNMSEPLRLVAFRKMFFPWFILARPLWLRHLQRAPQRSSTSPVPAGKRAGLQKLEISHGSIWASSTTSRTSGWVNSPKTELVGRRKLASILISPPLFSWVLQFFDANRCIQET